MSEEGTDATAQPAAVAPSANILTATRNAAGMSLADAARHLKLSPWQVEALESGDYARLPGPVFVRGFIRNYARVLKIDATPLLAEIAGQIQAAAPAVPVVESASEAIPFPGQRSFNWRPYAVGLLVIVAALVGYEFYGDGGAPEAVDTQAAELLLPKVVAESEPPAAVAVENTVSAPAAVPAAVTAPLAQRGDTVQAPAPVAPAETRPVAAERAPNGKVLRLMFTRESWVEVRDGQGRIIFSRLNPAGTAEAVSGLPPLRLVVGNASGVRLLYNDRPVDLAPHTQVDIARLTLE